MSEIQRAQRKYYHQGKDATCLLINDERLKGEQRQYLAYFKVECELCSVWIDEEDLEEFEEHLERYLARKKTKEIDWKDYHNWKIIKSFYKLKQQFYLPDQNKEKDKKKHFQYMELGPVKRKPRKCWKQKKIKQGGSLSQVEQKDKVVSQPVKKEKRQLKKPIKQQKRNIEAEASAALDQLIKNEQELQQQLQKSLRGDFKIPEGYQLLEVRVVINQPVTSATEKQQQEILQQYKQRQKKQEIVKNEYMTPVKPSQKHQNRSSSNQNLYYSEQESICNKNGLNHFSMDSQGESLISIHKSDPSPGPYQRSNSPQHNIQGPSKIPEKIDIQNQIVEPQQLQPQREPQQLGEAMDIQNQPMQVESDYNIEEVNANLESICLDSQIIHRSPNIMASQQPEKAQDPVEQGQNAPEASEEAHREVIDVNAAENQEAVIIDDPIGSRESAQREALAQELESGEVQEEENPLGSQESQERRRRRHMTSIQCSSSQSRRGQLLVESEQMHSSGNKSKKKDDDVVEIDAAGYQKSVKDDSKPTKEKSIKKVIPEKPHLQKAQRSAKRINPEHEDFGQINFTMTLLEDTYENLRRSVDNNTLTWTYLTDVEKLVLFKVLKIFDLGSIQYIHGRFWSAKQGRIMEKFIQFEVFQEVYPDLNSNEALDKLSKVKSLKINMQ